MKLNTLIIKKLTKSQIYSKGTHYVIKAEPGRSLKHESILSALRKARLRKEDEVQKYNRNIVGGGPDS